MAVTRVRATVQSAAAARNALDLCCCTRLYAVQLDGADQRVQVQEQPERRALAAGAAGLGRAVNNLTGSAACKWLLHGALRLCRTAVHALWPSLRALV